jgi:uncharacterized protein (TIGR00730 family)
MKSICVYCGSSPGARSEYAAAAAEFGALLAREQLTLVYGGSNVGLMRVLADTVMQNGSRVVGVLPRVLESWEVAHDGLTELVMVETMHDRKFRMAELADAFVALPGGLGTLDELAEILVWSQIGSHRKPVAVLNVAGYFNPFLAFLDHMVTERFLRAEQRATLIVESAPAALLARLRAYEPVIVEKWVDRG